MGETLISLEPLSNPSPTVGPLSRPFPSPVFSRCLPSLVSSSFSSWLTLRTAPSQVNSLVIFETAVLTSAGTLLTRSNRTSSVVSSSTMDVLPCWDSSASWSTNNSEVNSQLLDRCRFVLLIDVYNSKRVQDVISGCLEFPINC